MTADYLSRLARATSKVTTFAVSATSASIDIPAGTRIVGFRLDAAAADRAVIRPETTTATPVAWGASGDLIPCQLHGVARVVVTFDAGTASVAGKLQVLFEPAK